MPVRALTSAVLPWSNVSAVPTMMCFIGVALRLRYKMIAAIKLQSPGTHRFQRAVSEGLNEFVTCGPRALKRCVPRTDG